MAADSSAVDAALVALLLADTQLQTLMPDGVYFGDAAPGATRFVMVAQLDHDDEYGFESATFWETFNYMVKAVALSTSGGDAQPRRRGFMRCSKQSRSRRPATSAPCACSASAGFAIPNRMSTSIANGSTAAANTK
jgi:hypothetical protein